MNGSVKRPRNMFIASKVVCCEPVASSPEACVRPAGVSSPNTSGMPPVVLKRNRLYMIRSHFSTASVRLGFTREKELPTSRSCFLPR